jgi:hypothetical protein
MQNYERTILSQYANSATLKQLISNFNDYIDPKNDIDSFYQKIWNIDTAIGYGLDVWGRIVGVKRVLQVSAGAWLGFEEAGDGTVETPFNQAPFYAGGSSTANYALTDDAFRSLILAKAFANISDGSIPSINQILMSIFGETGDCWCTDGQDMTMAYTFEFSLSPVQSAIVFQSGVLPRPAGVQFSVVQLKLESDGGVVVLSAGISGYPTSPTGLAPGSIWSNGGVVCVVGPTSPDPSAPPLYLIETSASALLTIGGANLPIANPGVGSNRLWNNGGVVCVA